MKHILVILTCMVSMLQTFSMDTSINQSRISLDEMVQVIDTRINKQYSYNNSIIDQGYLACFPERCYVDIIATPHKCYKNINLTKNFLDKLYEKNIFFAHAIDHFVGIAAKVFKEVTSTTLNTIEDIAISKLDSMIAFYIKLFNPQTLTNLGLSPALKRIDRSIATYVIERAKDQTDHSYCMELNSGSSLIDFDISPTTHTAAISSGNEKTFYKLCLWNLKTATPLHTLEEDKPVVKVCFNNNGTQLAGLLHADEKAKIKIWNTVSQHLLYVITPDRAPTHLIYTNNDANVLCASERNYVREYGNTTLWATNPENYYYLGTAPLLLNIYAQEKSWLHRGKYIGREYYDLRKGSLLLVTKNNCHDMYLCEQAKNKARTHDEFTSIRISNPYLSLTEYEKDQTNLKFK